MTELDRTIGLLTAAKTSWEKQKATVHYLRGFEAVRLAEQHLKAPDAPQQSIRKLRKRALDEFEAAAMLDISDPQSLEQAAVYGERPRRPRAG